MTILEKYLPSESDTWEWHHAQLIDIPDIVNMAESMYQGEIDDIFQPNPKMLMRNIGHGILKQNFNSLDEQLIVAREKGTNRLLAWAWLARGGFVPYATEEIAEAKFAHMALDLPVRKRLVLLAQIIQQWVFWCQICHIPVLLSTTIREDQKGFMRLHSEAGFKIRGSYAYLKV